MKHHLTLWLLLYSFVSFSQPKKTDLQSRITDLQITLNKGINGVECIGNDAGGDSVSFSKISKYVFSTIVLGQSDIISNGSAISYSQDNNKGTFSIGGAYSPESWDKVIFQGSIGVKGKDNSFMYYRKNSWSNDITVNFGIAIGFGQPILRYMPPACKTSQSKRAEYYQKKIEQLENSYDRARVRRNDLANLAVEDFMQQDLDSLATAWEREFDMTAENINKYHGYLAHWLNINASYTNSSFRIENDSIMDQSIQKKYNAVSKFTIDLNYNFHSKSENLYYILQGGAKFNRLSLLDNPAYRDRKFKLTPSPEGGYNIFYYNSTLGNNVTVGNYKDIMLPVLTTDLTFYAAVLFGEKQTYGLNARSGFMVPYGGNKVDFADNYTLLVGPIIRLNNQKSFNSITITLNAGFENQDYNRNAWDEFILKVSAAIPFNIFEKKQS